MNWHETFAKGARAPTEIEESKALRVAEMVREALRQDARLKERNFDIVAVGSYRNNTNVRSASDADLAAVLRSAQWSELPEDGSLTREMLGFQSARYGLTDFRKDVGRALRDKFGASDVAPGKITLSLDETGGRLSADVTPYLLHRRYTGRKLSNGQWEYHEGIETRPEGEPGRSIVQWPEQHHASGVLKNKRTGRRYKRVVRILRLRGAHQTKPRMAYVLRRCDPSSAANGPRDRCRVRGGIDCARRISS